MQPIATPEFLEERHRLGLDKRDEVWDGELHMVPPAGFRHGNFGFELGVAIRSLAKARGLEIALEVGIIEGPGWHNFRVPDLVVVDPTQTEDRGIVGAATLVVEILSPRDESRKKLAFYASRQVSELWLIEPTRRAPEVFILRDGAYQPSLPNAAGVIAAPSLGVELSTVAGPKLRLAWPDGAAEI
jgi:Uma2 family endonuclease